MSLRMQVAASANGQSVAIRAMLAMDGFIKTCGLERGLLQLVKLRVAQIIGCSHGINVHMAEARARGETEARLVMLPSWRLVPLFTDRERAALAWAEALVGDAPACSPDEDFDLVHVQFGEAEIVKLTTATSLAATWNGLARRFPKMPAQVAARLPAPPLRRTA